MQFPGQVFEPHMMETTTRIEQVNLIVEEGNLFAYPEDRNKSIPDAKETCKANCKQCFAYRGRYQIGAPCARQEHGNSSFPRSAQLQENFVLDRGQIPEHCLFAHYVPIRSIQPEIRRFREGLRKFGNVFALRQSLNMGIP